VSEQAIVHHPASIEEALGMLASMTDARPLAGGQTLVATLNTGLMESVPLISLRKVAALRGVETRPGGDMAVGAMTTHREIAALRALGGAHGLLREAASVIAHPAIRNAGTIGGSICHADPAADYPAALLALDARVEIAGPSGARSVGAESFFEGFLTTCLDEREIVTAVILPVVSRSGAGVYEKFALVDGDFAVLSVALRLGDDGTAALALGGFTDRPLRRPEADAAIAAGDAEKAAEILSDGTVIWSDTRGSETYRRRLAPRLIRRALMRARAAMAG